MTLVISDSHAGIKASVAKVMSATCRRCRVHFMRNVLAHAGRSGRHVVSAFIATPSAQDDADLAGRLALLRAARDKSSASAS